METLYDAGFLRVGEWYNELCFEGRPNAIKKLHHKCVLLADDYDMKPKFEPREKS